MNTKHKRTLTAIFEDPVRTNIHYRDLEGMFKALGAEIIQRSGSRVAIVLSDRTIVYHRPHPENEIGRLTVRDMRDFLTAAGVEP